jgi:hypothetical protein
VNLDFLIGSSLSLKPFLHFSVGPKIAAQVTDIARRLKEAVIMVQTQIATIYSKIHTRSRQALLLAIRALPR